jgi:2-polyprenyl-3-methyl-5-hydroxy-6-metoxy-1,4-benzoquinol methylase
MSETMFTIQSDFDRIALLSGEGWDHNSHYHNFLLKQIPSRCAAALDIGCGTGAFSRLLATQSDRVLAIDLSPQMIQIARERSTQYPNIDFQVADAIAYEFPANHFDCVVSIATLHHLPLEMMLSKIKEALKINGVLVILDLFQANELSDVLAYPIAASVGMVLRLIKTGRLQSPRAVREAWAIHGKNDSYSTLSHLRQVCADVLPGAKIRKHLLWRYSITWKKARGPNRIRVKD